MKKDIDTDFADINKENKYKDYIIVGILYFIVVILFVLLILGIKNQKDIVKNDIEENTQTEIKEEDKVQTDQENDENNNSTEENIEDNSTKNDYGDELDILDQLG